MIDTLYGLGLAPEVADEAMRAYRERYTEIGWRENAVYDESAQLLSGSLMDYALPRAHRLVPFELDRTTTPCPHNPLGVKGVGEAGAIASPPAVVNAVTDALRPWGVRHLDMPLTAEKVWSALHPKA